MNFGDGVGASLVAKTIEAFGAKKVVVSDDVIQVQSAVLSQDGHELKR